MSESAAKSTTNKADDKRQRIKKRESEPLQHQRTFATVGVSTDADHINRVAEDEQPLNGLGISQPSPLLRGEGSAVLGKRPFSPVPPTTIQKKTNPPLPHQNHTARKPVPTVKTTPPKSIIQPKLTVGPVDDPFEKEADRMAEEVMQRRSTFSPPPPNNPVQRQPESLFTSATDHISQRKPQLLQRQVGVNGGSVTPDLESSINSARGGGQPLNTPVRRSMESAFNTDFSQVRVHNDTQSDTLNRSISAKAFTTNQDIFFSAGAYSPGSHDGQKLLAHELTHVVQQTGGGNGVQRQPMPTIQRANAGHKGEDNTFVVTSFAPLISNITLKKESFDPLITSPILSFGSVQRYQKSDFSSTIVEEKSKVQAQKANFEFLTYNELTDQLTGKGTVHADVIEFPLLKIPFTVNDNKLVGQKTIASTAISLPNSENKLFSGQIAGIVELNDNALEMKLSGDLDLKLPGVGDAAGVKTDIIYNKTSGYRIESMLTRPIEVGRDLLAIESLSATYGEAFTVDGLAHIKGIKGLKPFHTPVTYDSGTGLVIESEHIELDLPELAGIQPIGHLSQLKYQSSTKKFQGDGHIEADIPFLGLATGDISIVDNKIGDARLTYDRQGIAIPNAESPIISGNSQGEITFVDGQFQRGIASADLKINIPGKEGSSRSGDLKLNGKIENNELAASIKLSNRIAVHDYVELSMLQINIANKNLSGGGEFEVSKIKDLKQKIPIKLDDAGSLNSQDEQTSAFGTPDEFWGDLNYGFDFQRGFHARGTGHAKLVNGVIASGMLTYNSMENKFTLLAEVGNAPLMNRYSFTKNLFDKKDAATLLRFGALGGVYAEAGAKLDFNVMVGPITLNADGLMTDIDLREMTGDIEELNMSVEGGAQATIEGAPYLGLGSWFISDALVDLKGGLKIPMKACLSTKPYGDLTGMSYKNGEFKGPQADLSFPLVFQLTAEAIPYAHIFALNGLVNQPVNFESLGKIDLVKPRKLLDLSIKLNEPAPDNAPDESPMLESAKTPEAEELLLAAEAECDPVIEDAPAPGALSKDPGSDLGIPDPIDLVAVVTDLKKKMADNAWYQQAEALVLGIDNVAKRLSWSVESVLGWLEEKGIMEKLRAASGKLKPFADKLKEFAGSGYALIWALAQEVFSDLTGDGEDAPVESAEGSTVSSTLASLETRTLQLKLGPSQLKLVVPVKNNEKVTGEIIPQSNRLARDGFAFTTGQATFDGDGEITEAAISGNIVVKSWATLENVSLGLTDINNTAATVQNTFVDATLIPTEKLNTEMGVLAPQTSGSFENTQTRLIALKLGSRGTFKLPAPIGETGLGSTKQTEFGFEKTAVDWLLTSRATNIPFAGGRFKAEMTKYAVSPAGVNAEGRVSVEVDSLGAAEASATLEAGKFKQLDLHFRTKPVAMPEDDPVLQAQVDGDLQIGAEGLTETAVNLKAQVNHAQLNEGQPFGLIGSVDFATYFNSKESTDRPPLSLKLDSKKPIPLLKGIVHLSDLAFGRDKKGAFSAVGGIVLPSVDSSSLKLAYEGGQFGITGNGAFKMGPMSVTEFMLKTGSKGWSLGGHAAITGIAGFGQIDAGLYYDAGRLGLAVKEAKPPNIPGVSPTFAIHYLEYDSGSGLFNGHGKLGVSLPVIGYGEADLTVKDNQLKRAELQMHSTDRINLPSQAPIISGTYDGNVAYDNGDLSGSVTGDLAFGSPSIPSKNKPKLAFKLSAGSGLEGFIKQEEGEGEINDFLKLKGVDLKIAQKTREKAAFMPFAMGMAAYQLYDKPDMNRELAFFAGVGLWSKIMQTQLAQSKFIEKYTALDGTGSLDLDLKGRGGGGMKMNVVDNKFGFDDGHLTIGNSKEDTFFGKGSASYSPEQGLEFDVDVDAQISKGLHASGKIGYHQLSDQAVGEKGLDASLGFTQPIWKSPLSKTVPIIDAPPLSATIVPLGPIFIYGKAGVKLVFDYTVEPLSLEGTAAVTGIDLKNQTFEQALASLETRGGKITANLMGQPSLGLGAKVVSERVAQVEGGLKIPITAGLEAEPSLKTAVSYQKGGKPKGKVDLNIPLAFGIKGSIIPNINASLFSISLINKDLAPLADFELMKPRTIFTLSLNLGDVDQTADQKISDMAKTSSDQMESAPESLVNEQSKGSKVVESPTADPAESAEDDLSNTGPFNFGTLTNQLKKPLNAVGDKATKLWKATKAAAAAVGEAVKATAGALKNVASETLKRASETAAAAAEYTQDTLKGVANFLWSNYPGNPDTIVHGWLTKLTSPLEHPESAAYVYNQLGGKQFLTSYKNIRSNLADVLVDPSLFAQAFETIKKNPYKTALVVGGLFALGAWLMSSK